ncbi:hypothetical protein Tco_1118497 [Tanacetum coccineum]
MRLGDHAAHWSNLLGEIVKEFPTRGDREGVPDALWFLARHPAGAKGGGPRKDWDPVKNPDDETYDVEAIRSRRLANISAEDWDEQIRFGIPGTLAALQDKQMQSSATQEYPSLIQTFFDTHTVGGVFLRDDDRRLYEMLRLQGLGTYIDDQIISLSWFARASSAGTFQNDVGNGSGSGAGGDDESGDDEDAGEDEANEDC